MKMEIDYIFESKKSIYLDPRTKIFLMIIVTTIMTAGSSVGIMYYIRFATLILPLLLLSIDKKWDIVCKLLLTYSILFILELKILPILSGLGFFILGALIGIYIRILPGFIMGYYFISTTTVSEFIAAMERIHLSDKIIIPLSVVFRFFPTIKEEYSYIKDAMRMRGINLCGDPVKLLEYRLVPLMISITKIGEELSASALIRGLDSSGKRTNICKIGFKLLDVLLIIYSSLLFLGFIFL
ncbi:energy-coupling factor transporter transmembrane component T [Fenollaria sporofastidiosus]|uniref:energy-coupling factor transporter transmembrane component T n=1 Tax=Fenollaria sporofastidiosus TaxID=2811778 RepID=UPI001C003C3B|nr:energy-coupling factor transporter transmembrane component T [Fenollaria sporofastidiosus]